jgi:hypothetical protein
MPVRCAECLTLALLFFVLVLVVPVRDCPGLGTYDKVVSIEMIEAVGHEHLRSYFAVIDAALKPGGKAVIQVRPGGMDGGSEASGGRGVGRVVDGGLPWRKGNSRGAHGSRVQASALWIWGVGCGDENFKAVIALVQQMEQAKQGDKLLCSDAHA